MYTAIVLHFVLSCIHKWHTAICIDLVLSTATDKLGDYYYFVVVVVLLAAADDDDEIISCCILLFQHFILLPTSNILAITILYLLPLIHWVLLLLSPPLSVSPLPSLLLMMKKLLYLLPQIIYISLCYCSFIIK